MAKVNDWVLDAAREIQNKGGDVDLITSVIERHCPFKRDYAYHELPPTRVLRQAYEAGAKRAGSFEAFEAALGAVEMPATEAEDANRFADDLLARTGAKPATGS